jgi:hypothetical protein
VRSAINLTGWPSNSLNTWGPVPGLSLSVVLLNASPVEITWNLSVPLNGHIVTHLVIDGAIVPGTQVIVGNTSYATSIGSYYATLPAGSHTVVLEYRTPFAFNYDPTADWQAARLQVVSFDQ